LLKSRVSFAPNQSKTKLSIMLHKFFSTALVAVALLVSISACKKSEDSTPAADIAAGMRATVGGTAWTASTTLFSDTGSYLTISGITGLTTSLKGVTLVCPKQTGTYSLTDDTTASVPKGGAYFEGDKYWVSNTGTLTISSLSSTNVKGTFSFTGSGFLGGATGTKAITNGSFNITK